ncbi:MAG: 2-isopropylmalate synthase, partial [Clostridia bacterium]
RESFGYEVKNVSDHLHKELLPQEILDIFNKNYVNISEPIQIAQQHFDQKDDFIAYISGKYNAKPFEISANGNGR